MSEETMSEFNYDGFFQACCAKEESRFTITAPWVKGGYRYATDGRICARMKSDQPDTVGVKIPDASKLFWSNPSVGTAPVPDMTGKEAFEACWNCGEMGLCVCDDCECEHKCGACAGEGRIRITKGICVGDRGHIIGTNYAHLLHRFGIKQVELLMHKIGTDEATLFRGRYGEAEFLLMGRSRMADDDPHQTTLDESKGE